MTISGDHPIRLIDLGQVPSWQTQAYYHAVAEKMDEDTSDTLILCQPSTPYLCLGYHQIYDEIFSAEECAKLGLPVYRRRVGGGATYLDSDQLFYQFIFHHSRVPVNFQEVYARALAGPVETLKTFGLDAQLRAVNEIEVNGRRIAGIGGGRIGKASVVVGNFLFDFDFETMSQVWHAPWESYRDLAAQALQDRLMTLNELLADITMDQVRERLIDEIAKEFGRPIVLGELSEEEHQAAEKISNRIASPDYLALHQDQITPDQLTPLKIAAGVYIHAEFVEMNREEKQASLIVRDGIIQELIVEQISAENLASLQDHLHGTHSKNWQERIPVHVV